MIIIKIISLGLSNENESHAVYLYHTEIYTIFRLTHENNAYIFKIKPTGNASCLPQLIMRSAFVLAEGCDTTATKNFMPAK